MSYAADLFKALCTVLESAEERALLLLTMFEADRLPASLMPELEALCRHLPDAADLFKQLREEKRIPELDLKIASVRVKSTASTLKVKPVGDWP